MGYDREKERREEEERAKKAAESAKAAAAARTLTPNGSAKTTTATTPVETKPLGSAQDMERLGMGMKRLGFGAVPAAAPKARYVFAALKLNTHSLTAVE